MRVRATFATALAAALTAPAGAAPTPMPASWTSIRLVPSHNAVVLYDGAPRWIYHSRGAFSSSPTIVNNTVFLADNQGLVSAVDLATGKAKWTYHAVQATKTAPLVSGGIVYVGMGDDETETVTPRKRVQVGLKNSGIVALDATTGRVVWRVPLRGSGMSSSSIVSGVLVHHDGHGDYVGLDTRSGAQLWRRHVGSANSMSGTTPLGGGIVASAGLFPNEVLAVRASDGATLWRTRFSSSHSGFGDCPLAYDGTNLYGTYLAAVDRPVDPGTQATHHVYAIRAGDGKVIWDHAFESGTTPVRNESAIPVVENGVVYDGSAIAPYVHAIDAKTGKLLWRARVHGPVKGAPVIVDGKLYAGDLAGYLWSFDARSGRAIGSLRTRVSYNVGSPVVAGRSLVIGSMQGLVFAMPLDVIRRNHDG